jgi:hypothetical protein
MQYPLPAAAGQMRGGADALAIRADPHADTGWAFLLLP